jgi:MFS family permease
MILDWWGPNPITICCTSIISIGSIIAAVAIHVTNWRVLVTGHIIMGFGMAVLDQAQQKACILDNLKQTSNANVAVVHLPLVWHRWTRLRLWP